VPPLEVEFICGGDEPKALVRRCLVMAGGERERGGRRQPAKPDIGDVGPFGEIDM